MNDKRQKQQDGGPGKHRGGGPGGRRGGPGGKGGGGGGGRGPKGRRGRQVEPTPTTADELRAWFAGNLPDDWFTEPVSVRFDRDEIILHGSISAPKVDGETNQSLANSARIDAFRETTRGERIAIAERAEAHFLRKVSWTVSCGEEYREYTVANVPIMTRLRMDDRAILDTLIDAGVARSRSEALAWTVHLVAENEADWLDKLRDAMTAVEELRNQGPASQS